MKGLGNILNMVILGKSVLQSGTSIYIRRITRLLMIMLVSSMMLCGLMIFTLFLGYNSLLQANISEETTLLIIGFIVLGLMCVFAIILNKALYNLLKYIPKEFQATAWGKIIESFKQGLKGKA